MDTEPPNVDFTMVPGAIKVSSIRIHPCSCQPASSQRSITTIHPLDVPRQFSYLTFT